MEIHGRPLWLIWFFTSILAGQNQTSSPNVDSDPWKIGGDLYINYQPISKKTAFIRGQLPYQHWTAGWQIQLKRQETITIDFGVSISGGTPFDNPERLDYSISTLINIGDGFGFLGGVNAALNINQHPIVDPFGRIENTGINELFAGFSFAKTKMLKKLIINNQVYVTKNIRSNIPLFNNDRTAPYVGWRAGNNLTLDSNFKNLGHWKLKWENYLEGDNTGFINNPMAIGINLTLNQIIHKHFVWQTGGMVRNNIGQNQTRPNATLFWGIPASSAPIGNTVFSVWFGPRFTF